MMSFFKRHTGFFIVLAVSFFSIQPLFAQGFFPMHDDTQVTRVFEMKTAISDGMFPVRWVPNLGYNYGYPVFNFYGPLAYYVGAFFNIIGFDALSATKIMIGLGTVLAGISMYFFAREFWGKTGAIVSAVLYLYAPYHALNIYVRGAIGELWAYGVLPFAFFALYKVFKSLDNDESSNLKHENKSTKSPITSIQKTWIWISIGAISYATIVVAHNLTAMMVTPFLFVYAAILYVLSRNHPHTQKSYFILMTLLLGIVLSAFYWLPALFEMKYTNVISVVGGGSDYIDHFVCLGQLWDSPWGFAGSTPGCVDGMSFKIGKVHILLGIAALIPLVLLRKNKRHVSIISLGLIASALATFFTTEYSKVIWDAIPHMAFFQFPWRFLIMTSFFLSFLGGAIFLIRTNKTLIQWLAVCILIFSILFLNLKLFAPDKLIAKSVADYTDKARIQWEISKISDEYMPPGFLKPKVYSQVPTRKISDKKGVEFLSYSEKTHKIHAVVNASNKTDIQVNVAYFPGWHVYIDGKQEYFKFYNKGLLVTVPEGKHTVDIAFSETPVERTANGITLAGILVLLAAIIFSRKDSKRV